MLSLLFAIATLSPAVNDASYADLAYARPATEGACAVRFDGGGIEITQAFNRVANSSINVVMVTGRADRPVRAGSRIWVSSGYGPAWRALVTASTPQRITFVTHHRFIGDLFAEDVPMIALYDRLDTASPRDSVQVTLGSDLTDFRVRLARARDCADAIGL